MALDLNWQPNNDNLYLGVNGTYRLFPTENLGKLDTAQVPFTFANEHVEKPALGLSDLNVDLAKLFSTPYEPSLKSATSTNAMANLWGEIEGDLLDKKHKAQVDMFQGAVFKTVASASDLFNSLVTFNINRDNINLQKKNAKLTADNQMAAIDNQVLYTKNQLMDRFNNLVAQNAVLMAAKGLKVTAGALLEQSKETAHDITMDFRTLESNAELRKIALRNQKKQADITSKLAKTNQVTDVLQGAAKLGLSIATGGGTGASWGNLYAGYEEGSSGGSLSNWVY